MLQAEGELGDSKVGRSELEAKKARRLRFMVVLYDMVDGFDAQPVETAHVATKLGLDVSRPPDRLEILKQIRYLEGEGLLTASGSSVDARSVTITHKGVREVEEAKSNLDQPTEHFPPLNSAYVNATTASPSLPEDPTASQALALLSEQNRLEVVRITQSLRDWAGQLGLDYEQRAEFDADIRTIESQLESPRPKAPLIQLALKSIESTVRKAPSALGTTTGIISSGILSTIESFMDKLDHGARDISESQQTGRPV